MTSPLATAEALLDAERLSQLVGSPVKASRLRLKPGLSCVAALHAGDRPAGWVQVATEAHHAKLENAVRRARMGGESVVVRDIGNGLWLAHGPVTSDPRLVKAFGELKEAGWLDDHGEIVRYNPLRRLITRYETGSGPVALRLSSQRRARRHHRALRELTAVGVPVVAPLSDDDVPATPRVTTWDWVGSYDLSQTPPHRAFDAAQRAGQGLRQLHEVSLPTITHRLDFEGQLRTLARDVASIIPDLEARTATVMERITASLRRTDDLVLSHGDFSADQIAVADHRVWLLDLDRLTLAPPLLDLGMFEAARLLDGPPDSLTAGLLAGYGVENSADLVPWVARGLATRLMDPFRRADPDWRSGVDGRLTMLEELL